MLLAYAIIYHLYNFALFYYYLCVFISIIWLKILEGKMQIFPILFKHVGFYYMLVISTKILSACLDFKV